MNEAKPVPPENDRGPKGTKALILDTALRIASREGIEGLTIGELAKAVGMSKSGLFAHFGGKDQLQLNVLTMATGRFVDMVMKPAFKQPRGEPRIKQMLKNWLEHLNDASTLPGGSILIAASIELDDRPGVLRDFVQSAQKDLISNIEKAATIAVEEGHFRKDLDVEQFAWSLYSFVLGYHHFKRMLEDPKAELHLKRSFKGLLEISRAKPTEVVATARDLGENAKGAARSKRTTSRGKRATKARKKENS
jgi:AcrR family transcriptional regulator